MLEREQSGRTFGLGKMGHAHRAHGEQAEGHDAEAAAWIRRAIDETGAHELALFKAAAQMAAGVMGGDPATAAAGETWMRDSGAKAPRSLARMLAPGITPIND